MWVKPKKNLGRRPSRNNIGDKEEQWWAKEYMGHEKRRDSGRRLDEGRKIYYNPLFEMPYLILCANLKKKLHCKQPVSSGALYLLDWLYLSSF